MLGELAEELVVFVAMVKPTLLVGVEEEPRAITRQVLPVVPEVELQVTILTAREEQAYLAKEMLAVTAKEAVPVAT
jgi:hypothetical protein